jgi:hypothetical protein
VDALEHSGHPSVGQQAGTQSQIVFIICCLRNLRQCCQIVYVFL